MSEWFLPKDFRIRSSRSARGLPDTLCARQRCQSLVTRCPSQFSHLGYLLLEHAVVTPDFSPSRCDMRASESAPCPCCVSACERSESKYTKYYQTSHHKIYLKDYKFIPGSITQADRGRAGTQLSRWILEATATSQSAPQSNSLLTIEDGGTARTQQCRGPETSGGKRGSGHLAARDRCLLSRYGPVDKGRSAREMSCFLHRNLLFSVGCGELFSATLIDAVFATYKRRYLYRA